MSVPVQCVLLAIAGYLLGSISCGLIVAKLAHGPNLYEVGSHSTGASNVLRSMGVKWGLVTFLGDYAKGLLAAGLGWLVTGEVWGAMLGGLMCVIGHNWPVFYGFKGGKGVAVSTAVALVCFPVPALISYAVTIAVIALLRYISLGSMIFVTLYGILVIVTKAQGDWRVIVWAILMAVICIARHHANIGRLIRGEERRIGQRIEDEKA